jgi:hypothetical protein
MQVMWVTAKQCCSCDPSNPDRGCNAEYRDALVLRGGTALHPVEALDAGRGMHHGVAQPRVSASVPYRCRYNSGEENMSVPVVPIGYRRYRNTSGNGKWVEWMEGVQDCALTIAARLHAVNTQPCVSLLGLSGLDVGQSLNGTQARVLSQRHGYRIECIGKGAHRVLL